MSSRQNVDHTTQPIKTEEFLNRIANSAAYITLVIGYLLGILAATSLTWLNFLAFTASQVFYCVILWSLMNSDESGWLCTLRLGALSALAVASGLLSASGIYWDWLLYLATVSLYFLVVSLRAAIIWSVLLYLAAGINLSVLNHLSGVDIKGWSQLLAGLVFVAAFSLAVRVMQQQKERSEVLLHELEASNAELEQAHRQLQEYADEVEELTIVRERTRLAREIHDTLGHYLSILNIQLETISKLQERDPARAAIEIAEARRVAAQSMQEVRNALAALRPTSMAKLSLTEAITELGHEFEHSAEAATLTLDLDTQLPPLSPDIQVAFYRAVQEALTNVRKHAQASKVLVRLRYEDEALELVVLDNGRGVANADREQQGGGFGLVGLRERMALLGGHVLYGPAEQGGYRVTARVPIPASAAPQSSLLAGNAI